MSEFQMRYTIMMHKFLVATKQARSDDVSRAMCGWTNHVVPVIMELCSILYQIFLDNDG